LGGSDYPGGMMLLKPTDEWYWRFCNDQQKVVLDLGDELMFVSHYPAKKLVPAARSGGRFSVEDASIYYQLLDGLGMTELPAAVKVQTVLNAIVAIKYHKPLMPQGWFFSEQLEVVAPEVGMVTMLDTVAGEEGYFLVVECNQDASLCLLLEPQLGLNEQKALSQFDLIKVMNNRLKRPAVSQEWIMQAV